MPESPARAIEDYLAAERDHQTRFLAELVKVPSDNPPGDCAPHAKRAAELLDRLGLTEAADRRAGTFSGGMQRRLDIAMGLIHRPSVLFLDEPTTGLDPEIRAAMWAEITRLSREDGLTILLTTHYLGEAEALCGRIAMLKQGRVVALDKTSALLAGTASTMLRFKTDAPLPPALAAQARVTGRMVQLKARDAGEVESLLATLRTGGVKVEDLEIGRADLEDVFLEIMHGEAA